MKRANKKQRVHVNFFCGNNITLNLDGKSLVNEIVVCVLTITLAVKLLTMSSSEVSVLILALIDLLVH